MSLPPSVNKNFVVQNGLTVGQMTIFAGNSDIRTSGNITVTGTGTINVPSIGVSSIAINDSSIAINDTGASSTIEFTLDNALAANVSVSGMNLPTGAAYRINQLDVLSYNTLKSGVVNSSLTSVGTLQNLTVSGNTAIDNTLYGRGVYDNSNRVVSTSSGAGNLSISAGAIALASTGPGATTVGSSTSVPVITTDAYGRVVALTSSAISTSFSVSGTSGTASVSGGSTLSFASTNGVTIAVGATYANISTPQDLRTTASPTFANVTISGISTLTGNVNIGGNLTVSGASVSIGASDLSLQDSIINLHTFANLQPLLGNDGADIGIKIHYYDNADRAAFLGRDNPTGFLEWWAKGTDGGNVFNGTNYGTIKSGEIWLANTTTSTSTTTGALRVGGGAGIAGTVYVGGNMFIAAEQYVDVGGSSRITRDVLAAGLSLQTSAATQVFVADTTGNTVINSTTTSTSTTTGALVVKGGAGIAGSIITGGGIAPSANASLNSGTTSAYWNNFYAANGNFNQINIGAQGIVPTSNVVANLGSVSSWFNIFYGKATQAQYADLAENYQADAIYEPGTVLMFGGENEVTIADADTTAVAGVVSTNPAHLMNGALQGARVVALALQGRVPCRVIGPVSKGDLLVSAGFGFAKTAPDRQLGMRFGQAIGKALENVASGTKATIEVVVGRV
jgi:hypothetical protein